MSYLRQVIVCRKDLCMPTGKLAAMVSHASMSFIVSRLQIWEDEVVDVSEDIAGLDLDRESEITKIVHGFKFNATKEEMQWLTELDPGLEEHGQVSMAKIVLEVHSEAELLAVEQAAGEHKLYNYRVVDSGHSHNKPGTLVAVAIGPDWPDKLAPVTEHLKVYR